MKICKKKGDSIKVRTTRREEIFSSVLFILIFIFLFLFRCDGLNNCRMLVENDIFGNPCPGTPKYLEIYYGCFQGTFYLVLLVHFLYLFIVYSIYLNIILFMLYSFMIFRV